MAAPCRVVRPPATRVQTGFQESQAAADARMSRDAKAKVVLRCRAPMNSHSLLLEIGTEELPSSFVDAALAALPQLVQDTLSGLRVGHGDVRALGTPRRLAVLVHGVVEAQSDVDEELVGPPETAAFKEGAPTKAAEAFAAKLGVPVAALTVVDKPAAGKQKAGRYVVGRRIEKGKPTTELLSAALGSICEKIPFRKSMRWGNGDATFGRPVQWLVALYGKDLVDVSFAGVRSGRQSLGHRFLSPGAVPIEHPDAYIESLRKAHVLVDRNERAERMMDRVREAARALGGEHDPEPMLVDENASLVEEPHVVTGSFDAAYLALPAAVIRSVARGHQRYFCVQKDQDTLLPYYLAVANTALFPKNVAKGNDRVMRARLSDARFFFDEDKKSPLAERVTKLAGIVFHHRLGTVKDKVLRLEHLAAYIASRLGVDDETKGHAVRAAHLCKADLVTLMVGEFPELQGQMGRVYAQFGGEPAAVAKAISEHYRPLGGHDAPPDDDVSSIVALADRIDTLAGCFAVGLQPSGTADPYALRRNCLAALRILMAGAERTPAYAALRLEDLVAHAYRGYAWPKAPDLGEAEAVKLVTDFASERLRGLLATETATNVSEAVMGGHTFVRGERVRAVSYPAYARWRALTLHEVVTRAEPWLDEARTVAKRLHGISKTAKPTFHAESAFGATDPSAGNGLIVRVVRTIDELTRSLESREAAMRALEATQALAEALEKLFRETLVNDPNDAATPMRLELLSFGADCMLRIADFARLG